MSPDLLRQRRNLILVSGGLLLFDFAKVTVTKISIMGTELLVGDVKVLIYFAWVMWVYFFLRYYQYLKVESDLGIWNNVMLRFESKAKSYVFKKLNKTQIEGNIDFKRRGLRWVYSIKGYRTSHGDVHEIEADQMPQLKSFWWMVQSFTFVAVHTPKATDHILPFLLAIAAPVVSIIKALHASV